MTLARTPYARLSPADIGQVDRELKKLEQMSAGLYVPKVLVAARSPYTVQGTDTMLLCDCTAGAITLTFPLAARVDGMCVQVVKSDTSANAVTLSGTFSGVASPTLTVPDSGFTVLAMNGAYHVTAFVSYPIVTGESGVVSFVYPYGDVRRYGATGVAGTNARAAFAAADAAAIAGYGGNKLVHVPGGTHRIASNLTMTSAVSFEGGIVKPDSGVTVTLNGVLTANPVKLFDISAGGTIVFGTNAASTFYAEWWGAVGDSITDDHTALQSAVTAAQPHGRVQLLGKWYFVSQSITTIDPLTLEGVGSTFQGSVPGTQDAQQQTVLQGSINGYIIDGERPHGGILSGYRFANFKILNSFPGAGGCIRVSDLAAPVSFTGLNVSGYRCLTIDIDSFSVFVYNCAIVGQSNAAGGWGIQCQSHLNVASCDVTLNDNGIRHGNGGLTVHGGRFEVNRTAIVLGLDGSGVSLQSTAVSIKGVTMEANDIGIDVQAAAALDLSAVSIQGSTVAPSGQSQYGLKVAGTSQAELGAINVGGGFAKTAIRVSGVASFRGVFAANTITTGKVWDVLQPEGCRFVACNYDPKADGVVVPDALQSVGVRSLAKVDYMRGTVFGKNLRGYNVAVASAATFLDVAFTTGLSAGSAVINTATAVNDVTSVLPAGTYFYIASLVTESGETQVAAEKTVVVGATQRVDLTFFGAGGTWKRRIYRGTATGVYDGYFETAINSSATFSDLGAAAFTGKKNPPITNSSDCAEPDTNYAVTVAPQWNTATWISNKATTGFRVNFATAPGSNTALDWHILR